MDFKSLPPQYDHAAAQARWYPEWERRGYFHAEPTDPKPPFSIVIPPPNVTGALHLGHALNNTLQDILVRMKRMQGYNVLWMPGTDHAGIATQAVVERRLFEEEKKTRHDLGRDGLVARIWKWKDQYEARILSQLKQLGCSCDWERTQFTFNEHNSRAVREWYFRLFKDRKIYRGKRLVNWDTFLQTAVSDDEVFHEAVKGHFWHFVYPVVDPKPDDPKYVRIATTRPETLLGDTAVAVHPDPANEIERLIDGLRRKLKSARPQERSDIEAGIETHEEWRTSKLEELEKVRRMAIDGRLLELPLTGEFDRNTGRVIPGTNRRIPIILDEWAKVGVGSGCVKITPAHDENDYTVWLRHPEIGICNVMNPEGTLNGNVPERYRGLKMHTKARDAVVADMKAADLLIEIEDREIDLPHSDRSKTPIEPYLADQWFMRMDELAQTAMDAVTDGRVKIVPERYAKGYLDWLREKRDWPIGRQLWWGHRIPVWSKTFRAADFATAMKDTPIAEAELNDILNHDPLGDSHLYMKCDWEHISWDAQLGPGEGEATVFACINCGCDKDEKMLEAAGFQQESDVLDTWFSSALWPHSTLGWPDETPELKVFYPTSALITSRDIITLWVARMVLAGLYNMDAVPFHEVYITPKILDGYGETMSKSKGNGVDPLDIIEKFGADALRFGIAYLTTDTQDVKLPVEFECPHCQHRFQQTKKNRQLPRIECEKCGQPFSTQWAEKPEDKALPRGAVVSERFELGRNFCNKLWNAARFSLINLEGYTSGPVTDKDLLLEDRWLLSRLSTVTEQVTSYLHTYRYADAARTLYDFAWNEFCSFYVEMTKARFAVEAQRATAQRVLAHALDVLLRLLHPMIPFLTEEVWHLLAQAAPSRGLPQPREANDRHSINSICIASWPIADTNRQDAAIEEQFAVFQAVLGFLRETRQTRNIALKEELAFTVRCDAATAKLLQPMQPYFTQMARATMTTSGPMVTALKPNAAKTIPGQNGPIEVFVDLSRFIDPAAEQQRSEKERANLLKQIDAIEKKLANKAFVDNAPAEVVQQQRDKLAELRQQLGNLGGDS